MTQFVEHCRQQVEPLQVRAGYVKFLIGQRMGIDVPPQARGRDVDVDGTWRVHGQTRGGQIDHLELYAGKPLKCRGLQRRHRSPA